VVGFRAFVVRYYNLNYFKLISEVFAVNFTERDWIELGILIVFIIIMSISLVFLYYAFSNPTLVCNPKNVCHIYVNGTMP